VFLKDLVDLGSGADVKVYPAVVDPHNSSFGYLENESESRFIGNECHRVFTRGKKFIRVGGCPGSIDRVQLRLADPLPRVDLGDPQMTQIRAEHWQGLDKCAVCLSLRTQRLSEEPIMNCARNSAENKQVLEVLRVIG